MFEVVSVLRDLLFMSANADFGRSARSVGQVSAERANRKLWI